MIGRIIKQMNKAQADKFKAKMNEQNAEPGVEEVLAERTYTQAHLQNMSMTFLQPEEIVKIQRILQDRTSNILQNFGPLGSD